MNVNGIHIKLNENRNEKPPITIFMMYIQCVFSTEHHTLYAQTIQWNIGIMQPKYVKGKKIKEKTFAIESVQERARYNYSNIVMYVLDVCIAGCVCSSLYLYTSSICARLTANMFSENIYRLNLRAGISK